jgi:hypothetical protein
VTETGLRTLLGRWWYREPPLLQREYRFVHWTGGDYVFDPLLSFVGNPSALEAAQAAADCDLGEAPEHLHVLHLDGRYVGTVRKERVFAAQRDAEWPRAARVTR